MRILVINLGGTSTKAGLYEDGTPVIKETLRHDPEAIKSFPTMPSQYAFRKQAVLDFCAANGIDQEADFRTCHDIVPGAGVADPGVTRLEREPVLALVAYVRIEFPLNERAAFTGRDHDRLAEHVIAIVEDARHTIDRALTSRAIAHNGAPCSVSVPPASSRVTRRLCAVSFHASFFCPCPWDSSSLVFSYYLQRERKT